MIFLPRKRRHGSRHALSLLAACLVGAGLAANDAQSATGRLETPAREALLLDFETGTPLLEKNSEQLMPPASMSKLMTIYLTFERLAEGSLKMEDTFRVSEKAWKKGGSKMFVRVNTSVSVGDLLHGVIVQSGNDACIVLAEGLAGSESAFAEQMTRKAHELGMENTTFRNSTGWPDPEHLTTAKDLTVLATRLIKDFPQYYYLFKVKEFTYSDIKQGNRNPLLYKNMGADGLKTGHTEEAGYGIVASAERDGQRLILVVNGLNSMAQRSSESERLIEWGFREFGNYHLFKAGETVEEGQVWLGDTETVPLVLSEDLTVTLTRKARRNMKASVVYEGPIPAPIRKGTPIARLVIEAPDMDKIEVPLLAGADVEQLGLIGRLGSAVKHIVWGAASR